MSIFKRINIKYKDEDGEIHSVRLDEIVAVIGFDYGMDSNVYLLRNDSEIIEVTVDGKALDLTK